MEHQNEEFEIDLIAFFHYLKKKILLIVAVTLVGAVLGFVLSAVVMSPQYTASTRMYVLNRSNETSVAYSDYQVSTYVLNDYQGLITGRNVTKEVIDTLGLDMDPDDLAALINVTVPANTRILQISITTSNAQLSADIANAVREVAAVQIQSIMQVDAVQTVYAAEVPDEPSGPSVMKYTALAAILGMVAVIGILTVIYIVDDTIRTEADVEKYLGLSVLGVMPASKEFGAVSATVSAHTTGKKMTAAKSAPAKK